MPRVTVDFWDVLGVNDRPFDLLPPLQRASTLGFQQRMIDRGSEFTDYLAETNVVAQQGQGLAARLRKENLPEKGNLQTGTLGPLLTSPNEAVAEEVHFLYDTGLRVLVTQRHRMFRASSVVDLICGVTGSRFYIQPKLRQDMWQRFGRMQSIGSLELKLATPEHHPDFSQTIPSIGTFLDNASDQIGAVIVELKFSMGHIKKKSLHLDLVRSIVRLFRRRQNVSKMIIKGSRDDETARETVDFIRERLVYSGEVRYSGRTLDRDRCQQLLRQGLEQHRAYLRSLL